MKKILIINTTLDSGGAARIAHDLFTNFESEFEMDFAYGRGPKTLDPKTFYFGNKFEMFIHIFLVRFFGLEGFGSYFSTKKLIRYIEREKFDLINIHNLHGYYLNFSVLMDFLIESGTPIIYSLHDQWPITWLPAHSLGCNHCLTGTGTCTNTYEYPKNYFPIFLKYMLKKKKEMFFEKLNMAIVCPSIWLSESIGESFLNTFRIEVIHNSIDTEIFKPLSNTDELRKKHNLPLDKKIVLFSASNLQDKSKGIHHIIEAARILKDQNYLFVGLGNGHIDEVINIMATGYIYDKNELAEFYALSDVFCFASSAETFLLSAAEALSCAVPVVGYDLPVIRELIKDDVGILVENTSENLSNALVFLLEHEGTRNQMGQNGRKLIIENYSKDLFHKHYFDLYTKETNKHD